MEKQKKKEGVGFATGIICLAILVGIWLVLGMFFNANGSGSGEFNHYAGPVLPMTSLNGAEGVEVQRNVDFDFTPYESAVEYSNLGKGAAEITDTYILQNTTGESRSLELVYGFQASFIDHPEEFPVITVDGRITESVLYPSVDMENLIWNAYNFETYRSVIQEGDFLSVAVEEPEITDMPLKAYHFTNLAYHGTEVAGYPMLTVTHTPQEGVTLWAELVDSIFTDDKTGKQMLMFRVDRGEAWLYVQGGELRDVAFGGNKDYNITETSVIDGVTYELEILDTTLSAVLARNVEEYDFWAVEGHDYYPNPGLVTPEILLDGAIKRMNQPDWVEASTNVRMITGLFHQVVTESRMMYLVFPVELAPGQSVTVEAAYIQEPSYDISGPKEYREGYDMATKLGSDLHFTALSSSLSNTDPIKLGEQNFGFDLDRGITKVSLDLSVERYYLEVHIKK